MSAELKRTALYELHEAIGAKLVEFGGWEMPLAYAGGTVAEHRACREGAVVFDVSHLGTVRVEGPGSLERLQQTLTNDLEKVAPGRAQYTHLLDEEASVLDDIIIWWRGDERFDVMPNASNTDRVVAAIGGDDVTRERTILAVQGPDARQRLAALSPAAAAVGRFRVAEISVDGTELVALGQVRVEVRVRPGFRAVIKVRVRDRVRVIVRAGSRIARGFCFISAHLSPSRQTLDVELLRLLVVPRPVLDTVIC